MKKEKKKSTERTESERTDTEQERVEEVERQGEELEDRLDELDELIDEALGEDEAEAERRAQEFVDGFKQEGGE